MVTVTGIGFGGFGPAGDLKLNGTTTTTSLDRQEDRLHGADQQRRESVALSIGSNGLSTYNALTIQALTTTAHSRQDGQRTR